MAENICEVEGSEPLTPEPKLKLGIALRTLSERPIHGMRHPESVDTCGWYIWCGDYSESDDFFQPIHIEHISDKLPQVGKYLSLPPGFRFLIDEKTGTNDVWFDKSLIDI